MVDGAMQPMQQIDPLLFSSAGEAFRIYRNHQNKYGERERSGAPSVMAPRLLFSSRGFFSVSHSSFFPVSQNI